MRKFALLIFIFGSCVKTSPAKESFKGFVTHHHTITRELQIAVFVPDNYDPHHAYPVLYFNDGEGLEAGSYLDMEALAGLIKKDQMESLILVGVYAQGNRNERYNPYLDSSIVAESGPYHPQGDRYSRQIAEVLLPYVEKRYTIDEKRRGLIGISLGGLQAGWMALKYPGTFSFTGALSPAFWVKDYALLKEAMPNGLQSTRFYFDMGTGEWNYYLPLIKRLEEVELVYGKNIFYREIPGARHQDQDWKDRMISIIRLFLMKEPGSPQKWTVEVECIPSRSRPGHFFQRINPVVFLDDGIAFSLAYSADYSIIKGIGRVEEDGRYEVIEGNTMVVLVKNGNWSEKVRVKTCK